MLFHTAAVLPHKHTVNPWSTKEINLIHPLLKHTVIKIMRQLYDIPPRCRRGCGRVGGGS